MLSSRGVNDDRSAGFLPEFRMAGWADDAWPSKRIQNQAAHPALPKTRGGHMFQVSWIPIAIAILQVIKEQMEE